MRAGYTVALLVTLLVGGSYWYYTEGSVCPVPITYHIGTIDPRFNIANDEVKTALSEAETVWESKIGRELFTYSDTDGLPVNFVFDDRQQKANEEEAFRETLNTKEGMSESVRTQYEALVTQYEALKAEYEKKTDAYEKRLDTYNTEVQDWNDRGGAPQDVYARLQDTQQVLAREQASLESVAKNLNELVRKMNVLSAQGNSLISDYNEVVKEYNNEFAESKEFTQGEYVPRAITIYQYDSHDELTIVLAHELGHALSLDHVEGETSIMYHLMGGQSKEVGLSDTDVSEFTQVCGDGHAPIDIIRSLIRLI